MLTNSEVHHIFPFHLGYIIILDGRYFLESSLVSDTFQLRSRRCRCSLGQFVRASARRVVANSQGFQESVSEVFGKQAVYIKRDGVVDYLQ